MMALQKAIDHVHVVVTSSHLPGWKENREAWSIIRKRLADITSTQQFVNLLDQLADQWAETEGETSPFVDQLRSQVAEFVTTVPTARATHLSQPQPVEQGEAVAWVLYHVGDVAGLTNDRSEMEEWERDGLTFAALYKDTPTIPAGHRVVPVEPHTLLADLRTFHEETEACDEFDLTNESIAALLLANLIEGTHYMLTKKGADLLAASPSAGGV